MKTRLKKKMISTIFFSRIKLYGISSTKWCNESLADLWSRKMPIVVITTFRRGEIIKFTGSPLNKIDLN